MVSIGRRIRNLVEHPLDEIRLTLHDKKLNKAIRGTPDGKYVFRVHSGPTTVILEMENRTTLKKQASFNEARVKAVRGAPPGAKMSRTVLGPNNDILVSVFATKR